MVLPEDHISDRTTELTERQPAILEESAPVKEEARRALSLMKDIVDALYRGEIDLAKLIDPTRREK